MEQIDMNKNLNDKPMIDRKILLDFVQNLEGKLSSIKIIHDQFYEFMSILSKTHETIVEELKGIKIVLNQTNIEQIQDEDEIILIDATKSEWDDDDDDDEDEIESKKFNRRISPSSNRNDNFSLKSCSSYESLSTIENHSNSLTNKRSSSLKKTDQLLLSRSKSPKSVSFNLNENIPNEQKSIIQSIQRLTTNEKKNEKFEEMTTPIIPFSFSDLSKQNQSEIIPKIENTLTNIRIHEIESKNGNYIRLLNISNSDDYDLSEHFLQQNIYSKPFCRFRFPFNTIIRSQQTVTVWCGLLTDINPQPPHVFVWKEQRKWETGPNSITILAKPTGQVIAWFRPCQGVNTDESSSDILYLHSKSNSITSDSSSISSISIKNSSRPTTRQSRLRTFDLSGNNKPPFAHSPNNPIHPDHNGTTSNIPNDLRSQMHQKGGLSQLLNRPKSSPFASHIGFKQDLISMKFLRKQQIQEYKKSTIQT